ncbi:MAG: hypothetical protein K0R20_2697 [Actinomycetia bacterium]|jgi:ABC-type branched-subunit amino acid transport system substrate-binding protein|nr:hypothetical protein [Actinomycetes bacterium]
MKRGWLVAVLTLLVVACTDTGGDNQDTVKIALEAPITGEQASNGVDMLNGAQLAAMKRTRPAASWGCRSK